jgi:hypothetical protein
MRIKVKLPVLIAIIYFFSCSCTKFHDICSGGEKPDSTIARSIPFECDKEYFAKKKSFGFRQNVPYQTQCFFLRDENSCFIVDEPKLKLFDLNELDIEDENVLTINEIGSASVLKDNSFWIISGDNLPYNPELIRIDNSGNKIVSVFINPVASWDVADRTLTGTNDGGCIISLRLWSTLRSQVNRYDTKGNLAWTCELPEDGVPGRAVECRSGEFVISFETSTGRTSIIKIDEAGKIVSEHRLPEHTGTIYGEDWAITDMIELPNSNLLLIVGGGADALVNIDQNGNRLWSIDGLSYVKAKVTAEDKLIVCYNKHVDTYDSNIALACINEDGTIAWEKTYGGTGNESVNNFLELPDKGFYIFGKTSNYTGKWKELYDTGYECYYYWAETIESEYFIKTDSLGNTCR